MADDPLDDLDAAGEDLLLLYADAGVRAMLVTYDGERIVVRCQRQADVSWLCQKITEQYEAPSERTLN